MEQVDNGGTPATGISRKVWSALLNKGVTPTSAKSIVQNVVEEALRERGEPYPSPEALAAVNGHDERAGTPEDRFSHYEAPLPPPGEPDTPSP